jgi:hypothetical protein
MTAAHRQFVEFVSAFFRDSNWGDPGAFSDDARAPVAFEACVDGIRFSIGYDPLGGEPRIFAYCSVGQAPGPADGRQLLDLLEHNVVLARQHDATYCLDPRSNELGCLMRKPTHISVEAFRAELGRVAARIHEHRRAEHRGSGEPVVPWADLA